LVLLLQAALLVFKPNVRPWQLYLAAFVAGTLIPLLEFGPWVLANGLDVEAFLRDLDARAVACFFKWDVLTALMVLVFTESRRAAMPVTWPALLAGFLVGVSSGLPLFLYLRERWMAAHPNTVYQA